MSKLEYLDEGIIFSNDKISYTYQVDDKIRDFDRFNRTNDDNLNWSNQTNYIDDRYILHPYGNENDLPTVIKNIIQKNYSAPGLLRKKTNLLWGTGPALYEEAIEDNQKVRKLVSEPEVEAWLESWDYTSYLLNLCEDYHYVQGCFTRFEARKSYAVDNMFFKRLHHVQPDKCRLASVKPENGKLIKAKPTHAIINDWSFERLQSFTDYKAYSLFDPQNPFAKPNSILYSNIYSFCSDYYSVPEIYGSLEWISRSTAVPLIFKAMSKNAMNLKFHIKSPQSYWDQKRKQIQKNCETKSIQYNEKMLTEFQTEFLKKIGEVLAGDENTGKYLHTVKSLHIDGINLTEHGWEIEVIDQKIIDFVNAQIKISQRADQALSSGIGLHTSLGNISETGKSDSGSEQYYALIGYLNTGVDIPEMIIMKAINYAIRANWPEKKCKLGFAYKVIEKQSDISPKDRTPNQNQA
jgi:hypothetical protein